MSGLRTLIADLPGSGKQKPTTQCVEFAEVYVIGSSEKALLLRFPMLKRREEWIARSQLCGIGEDDTLPDLDRNSKTGDHGTVRIPQYIVKKWKT